MIRDQFVALANSAITVLFGIALLYAIGRWLGWQWVGAIAISGIGAAAWDWARNPWSWRS